MNEEKILINEIVKHREITARILVGLATVGVASDGQLLRLCTSLSQNDQYYLHLADSKEECYRAVLKEAGSMLRTDGYLGKEINVRLPKQMGGGLVNAWFLTARGVAAARILDAYYVRFACEGLPCGTKKDRIPHELAVTECFLRLVEKQIVCDFIPERELKSRLMKRRHELRRQGINPDWNKETAGEETGDFRAVLLAVGEAKDRKFVIEGEAAINYRRAQIEAKPGNMMWFVTSKTQKEMVIATRKGALKSVWILNNVREPLAQPEGKKSTGKEKKGAVRRNKLANKILDYLRLSSEIYTGRALAGILNEDSGNVSRVLQRLIGEGKINCDETKLTPARHRGRPNKLFWHVRNDDEINHSRASRIKYLVLSEAISHQTASRYKFRGYSDATRQADFTPLDATKNAPVKIVIESPELSKIQFREIINKASGYVLNTATQLKIAVSTRERYEEIIDFCTNNPVLLIENKTVIEPSKIIPK